MPTKGNAIVVTANEDHIEKKLHNTLKLKQFKNSNKSLQKQTEMNQYLRELDNNKTLSKKIFHKI